MDKIEVVNMVKDHIDAIMVIENLCFTIPWSREAFIQEITNNKFARYLSGSVNGKIVGYAGMWKVLDEGHITNIAVHPEYRRTGVGSVLLKNMMELAKKEHIESMTLEVRKSNIAAQALYSKYGFEIAGLRKGYYADNGEDALIMWRNGI